MPSVTPPKLTKRERTQIRILEAFQRLLEAQPLDQIGVNAVVEEAKVGKGLLYEYFGGMEGLALAWAEWTEFNPSTEAIAGETLKDFQDRDPENQIAHVSLNYLRWLKTNPVATQLLAEELCSPSALTSAMKKLRMTVGKNHEAFFRDNPAFASHEALADIFILQAAANYLALRAFLAPNFNGIPLDTTEGWQMVEDMIEHYAQRKPFTQSQR